MVETRSIEDLDSWFATVATKAFTVGRLREWRRPAVRWRIGKACADERCSRIGGDPSLPADVPWPVAAGYEPDDEGGLVPFLAQVDLAEVAAVYRPPEVPSEGMLMFFMGVLDENGDGAVIYVPRPATTTRPPPEALRQRLEEEGDQCLRVPPHRLTFEPWWTVPGEEWVESQTGADTEPDYRVGIREALPPHLDPAEEGDGIYMFGWPQWVQGGGEEDRDDLLLLQLAVPSLTGTPLEELIPHAGTMYFTVPREGVARGDYSEAEGITEFT